MNRANRRHLEKQGEAGKQAAQQFTLLELQKAISIALEMKKASKGHLFDKNLKERCVFCGKSRRVRTDCEFEFMTFLDRVQTILINPGFFTNKDIEAIWLQHGQQYKGIRIPVQ